MKTFILKKEVATWAKQTFALGFLLLLVVSCQSNTAPNPQTQPKSKQAIEPQFKKEAELYVLTNDASDTLKKLDIELAERRDEIEYGMMYRKSMDEQTGMLFLMGVEKPQSFYMKNTYVSLDLIFINDAMEIVAIQKNAVPLDESSLRSIKPASLVLEIKGGYADKFGISEGNKVIWNRLP